MSESISRAHKEIPDPDLQIILYEPEIPANTGNIARLCAAAEIPLHLIHPLGFKIDDRHLKRAGLDYWSEVAVFEHRDFSAFVDFWHNQKQSETSICALSARGTAPYSRIPGLHKGCGLLFGPETRGLPPDVLQLFPSFSIPMRGKVRSLNLSTAVGIVTYHCLEKLGIF